MPRTIVTLPTYNEAEVISTTVGKLRALDLEVLVADDNSPDGTWKIVAESAESDPGIHLLHRMGKKGRGYAGAHAFAEAFTLGADRIVEMDADLSHRPEDVPALLAELDAGAQMVVGSRRVPGGSDTRDSFFRKWLTGFSSAVARLVLGFKVSDPNSGFRAYDRVVFEKVRPETLTSPGPGIVHELLYRAHLAGIRIREVPITFVDRELGDSKLTGSRLWDGLKNLFELRRRHRLGEF
jgi:dolichol-phosphate mannosyltransferase